jgi:hypothetical protein
MNRTLVEISLIVILSLGLVGCQLETAAAQTNSQESLAVQDEPNTTDERSVVTPNNEVSCTQWEQQILAATVRIQMRSSVEFDLDMGREPMSHEAISHATVVGGRYLLTHNHFKISPKYQGNGTSLYATLYLTSNEMIAEAATFTIAYADTETLMLEFTDKEGRGLFDILDIPSAQLLAWGSLSLEPGMEVAQINWDGTTTHINCVQIESVVIDEGTPRLDLKNYIQPGSSGGGVFWQSYHIANNWQRTALYESGSTLMLHQFSSAALNSVSMVTADGVIAQTIVTPVR